MADRRRLASVGLAWSVASDPVCNETSNWSWIVPSAAIRYTIRFVMLRVPARDAGATNSAMAWPLPSSYQVTGLSAVDLGGNRESPEDFVCCDRVRKSAASS